MAGGRLRGEGRRWEGGEGKGQTKPMSYLLPGARGVVGISHFGDFKSSQMTNYPIREVSWCHRSGGKTLVPQP